MKNEWQCFKEDVPQNLTSYYSRVPVSKLLLLSGLMNLNKENICRKAVRTLPWSLHQERRKQRQNHTAVVPRGLFFNTDDPLEVKTELWHFCHLASRCADFSLVPWRLKMSLRRQLQSLKDCIETWLFWPSSQAQSSQQAPIPAAMPLL